jgi:hypothetical protein
LVTEQELLAQEEEDSDPSLEADGLLHEHSIDAGDGHGDASDDVLAAAPASATEAEGVAEQQQPGGAAGLQGQEARGTISVLRVSPELAAAQAAVHVWDLLLPR